MKEHVVAPAFGSARSEVSFSELRAAESRVISSERLLGGASCVTIHHEGMHYVLRATRTGKLILTK